MAAIRKNLNLNLALQRFQYLGEPCLRLAECGSARDQTLERPQPRRAGDFPVCRPGQMAQLGSDAGKNRAAQRMVLIASHDLVELSEPSKDPRCQYVGPPGDAMPGAVVAKPAPHQIAGHIARGSACLGEIGDPAKAVPGGDPFRPCRRREPTWRGISNQLSTKLDLSAGDRRATLGVTRPTQADPHPQVTGDPTDQRVAIEWSGGERLKRI